MDDIDVSETELDSEQLAGSQGEDDFDILDNMMMARIYYPNISTELGEFKRLSEKRTEIANQIDALESEKERLDEEISENAEVIQEHLFNL